MNSAVINLIYSFTVLFIEMLYYIIFPLLLYSSIQALAASMKLSVSLQLLELGQSVGHLGWVVSSSQGLYLNTKREKTHTTQTLNIHVLSGIRIHGPGVLASEES
jgi:hypothetical protein